MSVMADAFCIKLVVLKVLEHNYCEIEDRLYNYILQLSFNSGPFFSKIHMTSLFCFSIYHIQLHCSIQAPFNHYACRSKSLAHRVTEINQSVKYSIKAVIRYIVPCQPIETGCATAQYECSLEPTMIFYDVLNCNL